MSHTEDQIDFSFLHHPVVILVTLVRCAAALYILIDPLWGLIWSVIFDILDAQVLLLLVGITRPQYHVWDKNVDWAAYLTEFVVATQYGLFLPFFLLLFYRFLGHFMFLRFSSSKFYFLFPNFFEAAFIWLVIFYPIPQQVDLLAPAIPLVWLGVILVMKLGHEFILHYLWNTMHWLHTEEIESLVVRKLFPSRKK